MASVAADETVRFWNVFGTIKRLVELVACGEIQCFKYWRLGHFEIYNVSRRDSRRLGECFVTCQVLEIRFRAH